MIGFKTRFNKAAAINRIKKLQNNELMFTRPLTKVQGRMKELMNERFDSFEVYRPLLSDNYRRRKDLEGKQVGEKSGALKANIRKGGLNKSIIIGPRISKAEWEINPNINKSSPLYFHLWLARKAGHDLVDMTPYDIEELVSTFIVEMGLQIARVSK